MNRLGIIRLLLAIGILSLLVVLIFLRGSIAARLPVPQASLRLASTGVTRAAGWTPVIHHSSGMDWALVPAGCFSMGSTDAQLEGARGSCNQYSGGACNYDFALNEQPAHQVCFDKPYWIGATEVTNARYGSGSSTSLYRNLSRRSWPRESVTWSQADSFCRSAGGRLPTEAEWEYAARGPENFIYPWGNEISTDYLEQAELLNPQDVHSVPADRSWVGAAGMAGNVMEWTGGWFAPYAASIGTAPAEGNATQQRVARGGSWAAYASYLLRSAYRTPYDPGFASSILGFRCMRDLE